MIVIFLLWDLSGPHLHILQEARTGRQGGASGSWAISSHAGWLSAARGQPCILEEHYQILRLLLISTALSASPIIHEYEANPQKLRVPFVSVCGTCLHTGYDLTPCNATPLDKEQPNLHNCRVKTPHMDSAEAHLSALYLTQLLENSINLHRCNYHLQE